MEPADRAGRVDRRVRAECNAVDDGGGGIEFLVQNEWPSYAFDGFQMGVVLGAWAVWYLPGWLREVADRVVYVNLRREGRWYGLVEDAWVRSRL